MRTTLAENDIVNQLTAGPVVVIVGRANLAEDPRYTLAALHEVLYAVPAAKVLPVVTRGNVRGAITAGLAPRTGAGTAEILRAAADGKIGTLVLLGADPASDVPDADLVRRGLAGARSIIAVDTFLNDSSTKASVVLPAAAFAEKSGTTTNIEGRVTRVSQKVTPRGTARADWMIAAELATYLDLDLGIGSLADVQASLAGSRCICTDRIRRSRASCPTARCWRCRMVRRTHRTFRTCRHATATTTAWWSAR